MVQFHLAGVPPLRPVCCRMNYARTPPCACCALASAVRRQRGGPEPLNAALPDKSKTGPEKRQPRRHPPRTSRGSASQHPPGGTQHPPTEGGYLGTRECKTVHGQHTPEGSPTRTHRDGSQRARPVPLTAKTRRQVQRRLVPQALCLLPFA